VKKFHDRFDHFGTTSKCDRQTDRQTGRQMLYQKCFISISFCTTCCADLLFTYKLVFGLLDVNVSEFFITQFSNKRRGHRYKLYVLTCKSSVRYNCFSHRVIRVWNILPHCVNFTTYNDFKHSLTISVLIKFCKLFFM